MLGMLLRPTLLMSLLVLKRLTSFLPTLEVLGLSGSMHKVDKVDALGPQTSTGEPVPAPPAVHCCCMYSPSQCIHLLPSQLAPTIPTLRSDTMLAALGPFIPDPRPKAKPPPPSVYEAAGWGLSAWAADTTQW